MEWERAKNYLILFLIILNVGLGLVLFSENRRYIITSEQEALVHNVLGQNGITFAPQASMQRNFAPMRPLDIRGLYYDIDKLLEIFFKNETGVSQDIIFGQQVFYANGGSMSISNGFISYENPAGFRNGKSATEFIRSYFPDFRQDSYFTVDDSYRIIYRQVYSGHIIHSNFIEFLVTDQGITRIEMQFGRVLGHTGTLDRIFSPDEALLVFLQRVRIFTRYEPMVITLMDMVYFKEYVSDQFETYQAVPFYRIFTYCRADRPFLINAFTNIISD